ncbi:hypothetical protein HanXRQr2_Chr12g0537251 [Helianthus annuus]|uniref:Uncharacterized protein n=1 Tax=Helianthus annuus TaxID=4232 RepID=A0A251T4H6_HELAN|nr:hypothetical protein HanXRQr2_Chr12g0537251 [Helianthus annuus]KAJ0862364.1 hypothetical protein HanPSC8_Chr12g0517331 [Helianthus annuus]
MRSSWAFILLTIGRERTGASTDLLFKLTVNSHTDSKFDFFPESSNAIDPDLDRLFQALRSKPKPKISAAHEDVDDLFARFAALRRPQKEAETSGSDGIGLGETG